MAYAPHRPVDLRELGADIYAFSWYKLYGPHVAQLFVSRAVQDRAGCMRSLGHYFKGTHTLEEKMGLAGGSYELVAALPRVVTYLEEQGWEGMVRHERVLQEVLLGYLRGKTGVYKVFGEEEPDERRRVCVVSFGVAGRGARELVERLDGSAGDGDMEGREFGIRWGHFYSKRLVKECLGCGDEGVVRVSLVHYNTVEEVRAFAEALDREVCGGER